RRRGGRENEDTTARRRAAVAPPWGGPCRLRPPRCQWGGEDGRGEVTQRCGAGCDGGVRSWAVLAMAARLRRRALGLRAARGRRRDAEQRQVGVPGQSRMGI